MCRFNTFFNNKLYIPSYFFLTPKIFISADGVYFKRHNIYIKSAYNGIVESALGDVGKSYYHYYCYDVNEILCLFPFSFIYFLLQPAAAAATRIINFFWFLYALLVRYKILYLFSSDDDGIVEYNENGYSAVGI